MGRKGKGHTETNRFESVPRKRRPVRGSGGLKKPGANLPGEGRAGKCALIHQ